MNQSTFATTTDEMVRRIGTISEDVGASVCFGTPVERDGHTVIPVARVSFGYGMGFGGGTDNKRGNTAEFGGPAAEGGGGGGGGGGSSTPVAVIDITEHGVEIEPVTDATRIAMSSFMFAGWALFWITMTIRTVARESNKTQRHGMDKAS